MCEGPRTTYGSQFSPFSFCHMGLGIKPRVPSAFDPFLQPHCAFLEAAVRYLFPISLKVSPSPLRFQHSRTKPQMHT